jgi:hypothetical protein
MLPQSGIPGSHQDALLLATVEIEVLAPLPRVPSRARLRRRFSVVHLKRERNTPQFLPKVFTDEDPSPRGIR